MVRAITHLLDSEFKPICETKRQNIDGVYIPQLVTCPACQSKGPHRVLDLKSLGGGIKSVSAGVVKATQWNPIAKKRSYKPRECADCRKSPRSLAQFFRELFCLHHTQGFGWVDCHKCGGLVWRPYR